MTLDPLSLILTALATCYWAYAISKTHGPYHLFEKTRQRFPMGGLTSCPICLSVWLAAGFYALMLTPLAVLVLVSAVAGLATVIGYYTGTWQQ